MCVANSILGGLVDDSEWFHSIFCRVQLINNVTVCVSLAVALNDNCTVIFQNC